MDARSGPYLKTLGSLTLSGTPPPGGVPLRAKDLALLVYLCVNGSGKHTRSALAALLWGDRDEARARHSLTQALRRLRLTVGGDALSLGDRIVEWGGQLACDALELDRAAIDPDAAEPGLPCYAGDFLVDLHIGHGAGGFTTWADERRAHFRFAAARVLAAQGRAAEKHARWDAALQLGLRLIEVEPMSQQAHRRVMRAWSAVGERALAVRHYHQFEQWLRDEWGELPDPATRALFDELRAGGAPSDATPAAQTAAGGEAHQSVFVSGDGWVRFPLFPAEGVVRATNGDAAASVLNPPRTREGAVSVSFSESFVATTRSASTRPEVMLAVRLVAVTVALGAVSLLIAALKP